MSNGGPRKSGKNGKKCQPGKKRTTWNKKDKRKKTSSSLLDGHTLPCGWRTNTGFLRFLFLCSCGVCGALGIISAGCLLQETALLGRASALEPNGAGVATDAASRDLLTLGAGTTAVAGGGGIIGTGRSGREMGNVLGNGVLGANVGDADV